MTMFEPNQSQKFYLANLGRILQSESITVDQAGLHAYSQVILVDSETLPGGMNDDEFQQANSESIPYMKASLNASVASEAPQAAQQQIQTSDHAEEGTSLPQVQGIYEKICNDTPIANLFQKEDLARFVDRICKEKFPLVEPAEVHRYFECEEFRAAL